MAAPQPSYPGVYVYEVPSGVRTIAGVSTSVTAFVGRTQRGTPNAPVSCFNKGEFERRFGGLWADGPLSYAVDDFFNNGGTHALIVRLFEPKDTTSGVAEFDVGTLKTLQAANPGEWGNHLAAEITHPTDANAAKLVAERFGVADTDLFHLEITDEGTGRTELFMNVYVSKNGSDERRLDKVLATSSGLVRLKGGEAGLPGARPGAATGSSEQGGGNDGASLDPTTIIGSEEKKTGMHALLKADIFNILCIPPDTRGGSTDKSIWPPAAGLCKKRRAFLIVDPPDGWDDNPDTAAATVKTAHTTAPLVKPGDPGGDHSALYFPRIRRPDPLRGGRMDSFVPSGAIAGVMARTDGRRGVWKAPAGQEAALTGVQELTARLTDQENGQLNPIGVNCLRSFPVVGRVVWGARTMKGADVLSDDYKYVPVRRLALFIEESLYRGTQWVVFEPNDEPLWAQIRLAVGGFMQRLFRQGAFQGASARDAYLVKCDSETTTQDDINRGIVNIVVGFAPLQPAEFVFIQIQQIRNAG